MAQAEADFDGAPATRPGKSKGLVLGGILALVLGGAGFYGVWSGLILGGATPDGNDAAPPAIAALPDIAFVPMDPILIPLGVGGRVLRFRGQVEVARSHVDDVTTLMPRIVDVLNSYLRAVEPSELEEPAGLNRLRAQMLRRAQIVTGEGRVRDLLIMEFVFN
ncbi:flagellar basal body-associated FliL family protein [Oceaniglobus indicus]|uniref:flagellar basal body-associated FliL family protein n=1 Tax=Oceaniglobus indicus TaxID=2047749 RepID=UPI000C19918B|nr:flagellar basal body-associated FliL family protein [Oceaniglobus indicus]